MRGSYFTRIPFPQITCHCFLDSSECGQLCLSLPIKSPICIPQPSHTWTSKRLPFSWNLLICLWFGLSASLQIYFYTTQHERHQGPTSKMPFWPLQIISPNGWTLHKYNYDQWVISDVIWGGEFPLISTGLELFCFLGQVWSRFHCVVLQMEDTMKIDLSMNNA